MMFAAGGFAEDRLNDIGRGFGKAGQMGVRMRGAEYSRCGVGFVGIGVGKDERA